jgi:hypothetical protein
MLATAQTVVQGLNTKANSIGATTKERTSFITNSSSVVSAAPPSYPPAILSSYNVEA